jgi:hypothetical protein
VWSVGGSVECGVWSVELKMLLLPRLSPSPSLPLPLSPSPPHTATESALLAASDRNLSQFGRKDDRALVRRIRHKRRRNRQKQTYRQNPIFARLRQRSPSRVRLLPLETGTPDTTLLLVPSWSSLPSFRPTARRVRGRGRKRLFPWDSRHLGKS